MNHAVNRAVNQFIFFDFLNVMSFYKIHRSDKSSDIQQIFCVKLKNYAKPADCQKRTENRGNYYAEKNFFLHMNLCKHFQNFSESLATNYTPYRLENMTGVFYFSLYIPVN